MKQRNLSVDAIKGFAILLVMIGHVFVHNQMEDPYIYDFIKAVQMPLFIIISGYLCGQGRKVTSFQAYAAILKKRAVSYLVPFFSWLTVMHFGELAAAYRTIFVQLDYGLWFFAVLFILTFMVYTAQLAAAVPEKKSRFFSEAVFWLVYGAMCLMLVVQILAGNRFLSPNLTIIYVPFYMLGYAAGNYAKEFFCRHQMENSRLLRTGALAAAVVFLYLVAAKNLNSMETRTDVLMQMLASVLGCAAVIYGICQLREGKLKKFLARLGNYTLEIYVIHYHFARVLNFNDAVYEFYTLQGGFFVLASFVVMSAATFCTIRIMKKVRLLDLLFFGKRTEQ